MGSDHRCYGNYGYHSSEYHLSFYLFLVFVTIVYVMETSTESSAFSKEFKIPELQKSSTEDLDFILKNLATRKALDALRRNAPEKKLEMKPSEVESDDSHPPESAAEGIDILLKNVSIRAQVELEKMQKRAEERALQQGQTEESLPPTPAQKVMDRFETLVSKAVQDKSQGGWMTRDELQLGVLDYVRHEEDHQRTLLQLEGGTRIDAIEDDVTHLIDSAEADLTQLEPLLSQYATFVDSVSPEDQLDLLDVTLVRLAQIRRSLESASALLKRDWITLAQEHGASDALIQLLQYKSVPSLGLMAA